jgi:2,3-bisphosphoglycerate-independent phosphoglycerate mutase
MQELMEASRAILAEHPVNRARVAAGKAPATQVWLWGQGYALQLKTYAELYGLGGGVVSAVDLVRGLGLLAGLTAPIVPGATGFVDTNYQGKVDAATDILNDHDFAYVHVEAPDECGHMGDATLKTEAISAFDDKVVGPLWRHMEERGEPYRLLVCMDHRTPCLVRSHTREPVPLTLVNGPIGAPEAEIPFDESVNDGQGQGFAHAWIREILSGLRG